VASRQAGVLPDGDGHPPVEVLAERGAATPTPDALSSDETALLSTMQQIASQYRDGEDIAQQAFVECLANAGGVPFPLSELAQRAETVWERERQRNRRAVKREVLIDGPEGASIRKHGRELMRHVPQLAVHYASDAAASIESGEHASCTLDIVDTTNNREASAMQREAIRLLEVDPDVQHAIRRALAVEPLTRTEQNKASRGKGKVKMLRKKLLISREKRRRVVLLKGPSPWASGRSLLR
jgi:hypothetical protein